MFRAEWATFGPAKGPPPPLANVPPTFERRCRTFLTRGVAAPAWRDRYTLEDAVELGLALLLLDLTMPESEVVAFIKKYREQIRQYLFQTKLEAEGQCGRFIVIRPRLFGETQGMYRQWPEKGTGRAAFYEPEFISDKEQWAGLHKMEGGRIVVEVGDIVSSLALAFRQIDAEEGTGIP